MTRRSRRQGQLSIKVARRVRDIRARCPQRRDRLDGAPKAHVIEPRGLPGDARGWATEWRVSLCVLSLSSGRCEGVLRSPTWWSQTPHAGKWPNLARSYLRKHLIGFTEDKDVPERLVASRGLHLRT
jgi:hypothetical protein